MEAGYLYLKLTRQEGDGSKRSVRYYATLPEFESLSNLTKDFVFQLEPIYSNEDLKAVAPGMPLFFSERIRLEIFVEMSGDVSVTFTNEHSSIFEISTEFSAQHQELIGVGGLSVLEGGVNLDLDWQCRLKLRDQSDRLDNQRRVIQAMMDSDVRPTDRETWLMEAFSRHGFDFEKSSGARLLLDTSGFGMAVRLEPQELEYFRGYVRRFINVPLPQNLWVFDRS